MPMKSTINSQRTNLEDCNKQFPSKHTLMHPFWKSNGIHMEFRFWYFSTTIIAEEVRASIQLIQLIQLPPRSRASWKMRWRFSGSSGRKGPLVSPWSKWTSWPHNQIRKYEKSLAPWILNHLSTTHYLYPNFWPAFACKFQWHHSLQWDGPTS